MRPLALVGLTMLAACAGGPPPAGPLAEPEATLPLEPAATQQHDLGAGRCDDPAAAIEVKAMAFGTYHPPTPESLAAWRAELGLTGELSRAEQHRLVEIAVHLGPPDDDVEPAIRGRLKSDFRADGMVDRVLMDATVPVLVCPEEVASVARRLGVAGPVDGDDRAAVREITAMLLASFGRLHSVPAPAWHGALHSLEMMQFGEAIQSMFEETDAEIDAVDANL